MKALFLAMGTHLKNTRSSDFFTDILKTVYPDLQIIDSTYAWLKVPFIKPDIIFIWQEIFTPQEINCWGCKNVVIIPMYDACPHTKDFWIQYKDFKVFCFSKKLYELLISIGVTAFYSQYFIPLNFVKKDFSKKNIFYWERSPIVNWTLLKKMISSDNCDSLHFHLSSNIATFNNEHPSDEEIKSYNITFSDWFKDKSEYKQILDNTTIYIAPRTEEGIGMTFLEAMSNGCVVLAYNNPTMNEYIIDGVNGILFDEKSSNLDLSESYLTQLSKQSIITATEGREKWEKSIPDILNFMQSNMPVSYKAVFNFRLFVYKYIHTLYIYIRIQLKKILKK